MGNEFETSEAASSRGFDLSRHAKVTRLVTIWTVPRGSAGAFTITCAGHASVFSFPFFSFSTGKTMNDFNVSITNTTRRRKLKNGTIALYPQWYCEYREPLTRTRRRRAFNRKKDAEAFRNALLVKVAEGNYVDERKAPTVEQAIEHWFQTKEGSVKSSTLKGYRVVATALLKDRCSSARAKSALITRRAESRQKAPGSSSCSGTSS
jgi:hypothetical protein